MAKHRKTRSARQAARHAFTRTTPGSTYTTPTATTTPLDRDKPPQYNDTPLFTTPSQLPESNPHPPIPPLTLGDRFNILPAELRATIFAHLLVRPVKWDLLHDPKRCSYITTPPWDLECEPTCASGIRRAAPWRKRFLQSNPPPIGVSKWHSQWSPARGNPHLCTQCYEWKFRPGHQSPLQNLRSLPCMCARRENLQVLLVCKKWYAEAGLVFYTRNTFAFAHADEVLAFLPQLQDRWRAVVSKVSLMALVVDCQGENGKPRSVQEEFDLTWECVVRQHKRWREAWNLIARRLPALAELEVDAMLLARPETARVLRTAKMPQVRKLVFSQGSPEMFMPWRDTDSRGNERHVWPRLWCRRSILDRDDEFACEVARGIKGVRWGWESSNSERIQKAMMDEREKYSKRFEGVELEGEAAPKAGGSEVPESPRPTWVYGVAYFD